jgi:hypothetical protein
MTFFLLISKLPEHLYDIVSQKFDIQVQHKALGNRIPSLLLVKTSTTLGSETEVQARHPLSQRLTFHSHQHGQNLTPQHFSHRLLQSLLWCPYIYP